MTTAVQSRRDAPPRESFDIAVSLSPCIDPRPYADVGATWWLPEIDPGASLDTVRGIIRDGPAR